MTRALIFLTLLLSSAAFSRQESAQSTPKGPSSNDPSFSVVSIRPSGPGANGGGFQPLDDGFTVKKTTIFWLLSLAYSLPEEGQILNAPGWVKTDPYDVVAKVDDDQMETFRRLSPADRYHSLVQIFRDRFHLQSHFETRIFPEFTLTVAKGNPKLTPASPSERLPANQMWKITGKYELQARGVPMQQLCYMLLSTEAQGLVKDQTNMPGSYDFSLKWSRDYGTGPTSDAPGIFTAVMEQLGLKLNPVRVPEAVLVIDHIDKPSEN